ncbi:MAG: type II secretion system F family protein [Aliidongia sp.]
MTLFLTAAIAYLAPVTYFKRQRNKYRLDFLEVFPDALDLIARVVRAGVPVSTGIEVAGKESPDPVRSIFAEIASQNRIGISFEDSLTRMVKRLNITDFSFFASALILQRESGGNIAETVSNLSAIVRKRKELRKKGEALTAEARTVAGVLSALPFLGSGLVALVNFAYISLLFTDTRGNIIMEWLFSCSRSGLGSCAPWSTTHCDERQYFARHAVHPVSGAGRAGICAGFIGIDIANKRERLRARVAGVAGGARGAAALGPAPTEALVQRLQAIGRTLLSSRLLGATEREKIAAKLVNCGIRDPNALSIFVSVKFGLAIGIPSTMWGLLQYFDYWPDGFATQLPLILGNHPARLAVARYLDRPPHQGMAPAPVRRPAGCARSDGDLYGCRPRTRAGHGPRRPRHRNWPAPSWPQNCV